MIHNKYFPLLLIAISLVGGYYYYSNYIPEPSVPPPLNGVVDDLGKLASLSLDIRIIESNQFKKLTENVGENPVNPGLTGGRDIFAPLNP